MSPLARPQVVSGQTSNRILDRILDRRTHGSMYQGVPSLDLWGPFLPCEYPFYSLHPDYFYL